MGAPRILAFAMLGFAICHVVILCTEDMGGDSGYTWLMACFFALLGAHGAGQAYARDHRTVVYDHVGLCAGAATAGLVSEPAVITVIVTALVLFMGFISAWARERRRSDET